MWILRVLTMKDQFEQLDQQLEKLRQLVRRSPISQESPHETGY